ncbi:hypothetical protein D3C87_1614070 [compost metagenome]
MSTPVSALFTAWMTPAMSPSLSSFTETPAVRSSSSSPPCRGRSRTMAVISEIGTPFAAASALTFSVADHSMFTVSGGYSAPMAILCI